MEDIVLYFSLKYNGNFKKIYKAIETKEEIDWELFKSLKEKLKCKYTTIMSDDYPERLKLINCPPFVLYYYGNLSYLSEKTIGVIGKRENDDYGKEMAQLFTGELSKNQYVIISGMAKGIDTIAHERAIETGGKTVAVLGTSIETAYPKRNQKLYTLLKEKYLVLSEYPFNVGYSPGLFPDRNRIIAGLSDSLLVVQADIKSGTMITVGYALERGKDIFCIPARVTDPQGTNYLIGQGAKLVMDVKDILNENG